MRLLGCFPKGLRRFLFVEIALTTYADNQPIEAPDIHSSSVGYADRFSGEIGEWFLTVQEHIFRALVLEGENRSLLDVGGGHVQIAGPACRLGFVVTVLGSAAICGNRLETLLKARRCKFKVGSMLELPFADREFDVVTCFRQMAHISDWRRLIAELCRVSGSTVIIDYPPLRSFNFFLPLLFSVKKRIEQNTRKFIFFSDRQIFEEFAKNGFEVEGRVAQFFIPMGLHRLMKMPRVSVFLEKILSKLGLVQLFGSPVILKMNRKKI